MEVKGAVYKNGTLFIGFFRKKTVPEQIRKYYRKWVLGGPGQTPGTTSTPEEAEETAGVADSKAHQIYEKARYSRLECTAEEAAYLKKRN